MDTTDRLSLGGVELNARDLKTLGPGQQLNDVIISGWLQFLLAQQSSETFHVPVQGPFLYLHLKELTQTEVIFTIHLQSFLHGVANYILHHTLYCTLQHYVACSANAS